MVVRWVFLFIRFDIITHFQKSHRNNNVFLLSLLLSLSFLHNFSLHSRHYILFSTWYDWYDTTRPNRQQNIINVKWTIHLTMMIIFLCHILYPIYVIFSLRINLTWLMLWRVIQNWTLSFSFYCVCIYIYIYCICTAKESTLRYITVQKMKRKLCSLCCTILDWHNRTVSRFDSFRIELTQEDR